MKRTISTNQRGLAQIAIIIIAVVVLGAIGFAGWKVMQKDKDGGSGSANNAANTETAKKIEAECKKEMDDKDLCKFISSQPDFKKVAITSTGQSDGKTMNSTMKIDGDKTYFMSEGDPAFEYVIIGSTTYYKAGENWWKQTSQANNNTEAPVDPEDLKFEEPAADAPENDRTKYEKQGKEACGPRQCFKYKYTDADTADATNYIWFDDKDYQLRKVRNESAGGNFNEMVFDYDNFAVNEPSPVKDLAPNQYIVPGQTEPVTMPDTSNIELGQ